MKKFIVELDEHLHQGLIDVLRGHGAKEVTNPEASALDSEPGDGDNGSDPRGNGGH